MTIPRSAHPGAPLSVPSWAQALLVVLALATAVIVFYLLAQTDFRLRIAEHRQIQQTTATIAAVVAIAVVGFTVGVAYPVTVAGAGVIGGVATPTTRQVGGRLTASFVPRERLLLGWLPVLVLAVALAEVSLGYASEYIVIVAQGVVFVGLGDMLALLRELGEPGSSS